MVAVAAGKGSQMVDADCGVHMMIDSAEAQTNQYGTSVVTKFSILASTDPAQVGKTITQFLETEKATNKIYNVSEAIGQLKHEERLAAEQNGVGLNIDETQWKGRQLCGEIKMKMKQRKNLTTGKYEDDPEHPNPYPQLDFNYFAVTSPRAAHIPKDKSMLDAAGIVLPTGPAPAHPAAQKHATQPPAKPQPQQPAQGQLPLTGPTTPMDMAW